MSQERRSSKPPSILSMEVSLKTSLIYAKSRNKVWKVQTQVKSHKRFYFLEEKLKEEDKSHNEISVSISAAPAVSSAAPAVSAVIPAVT
ncbi:hypothetical protein AgCh_012170 [Apium graveolens]